EVEPAAGRGGRGHPVALAERCAHPHGAAVARRRRDAGDQTAAAAGHPQRSVVTEAERDGPAVGSDEYLRPGHGRRLAGHLERAYSATDSIGGRCASVMSVSMTR